MEEPTNGQLPLMALIKPPTKVEPAVIVGFGDTEEAAVTQAIAWAWRSRRVKAMSQAHAAELLVMPPSHFCNILQGKKYLPLHKLNSFEELVGNTAVTQTIERFAAMREERFRKEVGDLVREHLGRVA